MKQLFLAIIAVLCAFAIAGARTPEDNSISLFFTDTDAGQVFKAISLRTGVNIVYSVKDKYTVSVSATVSTPDEAVSTVVSAAGLVFKKLKGVFVVSTSDRLRLAIEPYGETRTFPMDPGEAAKSLTNLQDAFPYATLRTVGDNLVFVGSEEDSKDAGALLDQMKQTRLAKQVSWQSINFTNLTGAEASALLADLCPEVKIAGTANLPRTGAFEIGGPSAALTAAVAALSKLDSAAKDNEKNGDEYRVYHLRYTSGPVLTEFLKQAMPNIQAVLGPEAYSPPRPVFNPLTSQLNATPAVTSSTSGTPTTAPPAGPVPNQVADDHKIQLGDRAKTIILKGKRSLIDAALELIAEVDVKPRQVMVEVEVIETTPSFAENLGLDWNINNTQTVSEGLPGAAGIGFGTFTRTTPLSFSANLNASLSHGEGKLLAHPKVQVLDNDDATIFIGDTIRSKIAQSNGLGGQTIAIQEFPIGIILLIRPRVDPDGNITMHVNPVVSTVASVSSDGVPQTATREAETTVIIKDGQTVVIGGLIRDDESKVITEIPFLSKLPIVGSLFRNRNTTRQHTDVIVTITPHLVQDSEAGK